MYRPTLSPRTWLYVVVITLVLSGCQRTPPAGPDTLTGVVTEGWSGQAASLRLEAVTFSNATVLAEVPVSANGSFTLTLPDQQEVAGALIPVDADALCALYRPDPTSTPEVTPSPLSVLYAEARVYASTAADAEPLGVLGYHADSAEGLISVVQVYAASAGTVKGSCQSGELAFDLNLVAGWNEVVYTQSGNSITLTTGNLPDGLRWRFYATSGEPESPGEPPTTPVEPPEPTPTPTPEVVSGTIEGWTGEEAVVRAEGYNFETEALVTLAEGNIGTDGSCSLSLPVDEEIADALFAVDSDTFCYIFDVYRDENDSRDTVEVTPAPVDTTIVAFLVYSSADSSGNEPVGDLLLTDDTYSVALTYHYAASSAAIKGDCVTTYPESEDVSTDSYDLDFKAGWNKVTQSNTSVGSYHSIKSIPAETRWSFFER